jgi:hypothetical protein
MGDGGRSGSGGVSSEQGPRGGGVGGTNNEDAAGAVAEAEAGAGGAAYDAPIASGTRGCENDDYCFGLSCYAPAGFAPTVCLAPCNSDANCRPSEACLRAPKLEPTCYARCKSPEDCYDGFDCYDFSGADELICFPASWSVRRGDLGY